MANFQAADHAMGLELQIEELMEQRQRAVVQGRTDTAGDLGAEIELLQQELAVTAERVAQEGPGYGQGPELHNDAELGISEPSE